MDLIETVIDHVIESDYQDLDPPTIDAVKLIVVDTMGVAAAGSSGEGIARLLDLIKGWGGKPEASILVYGQRVSAFQAALINCTMARAWDLDDVHEAGGGHLGASLVPTAFILAQYAKAQISGRDLILAIAIATDLVCRLRSALKIQFGWGTETFVPFGVVAIASRFLGFDREKTRAAMGLAYTQISCNGQGTVDGALSVRLQQGLAAKAGVLAVQFAQIGFTGPTNILQGVYGLYPLYGRDMYDPTVITRELGERFEIVNTSIKPYPSCKQTHIPIAAIAKLVKKHAILPTEIRRVIVHTNQMAYDRCASNPAKYSPNSVVDAQFSIPIMAALATINGKVSIGDLIDESWKNRNVLDMAAKVEVRVDPELDKMPYLVAPNIIELETIRGRFVERVEFVKGSPQDRMSFSECSEKFKGCIAFAAKPIDKNNAIEFLQMADNLDRVDNIRRMAELLVA